MIFRVQQNLAKWSSRILKRLFDIVGSIAIIIVLSPIYSISAEKLSKMVGQQSMAMNG
jgi:undecaprenyl-phosphate galactose phosphotransferase